MPDVRDFEPRVRARRTGRHRGGRRVRRERAAAGRLARARGRGRPGAPRCSQLLESLGYADAVEHHGSRRPRPRRRGPRVIDEAVAALRAGKLAILPTDTVYGLAATPPTRRRSAGSTRPRAGASDSRRALVAATVELLLERRPRARRPRRAIAARAPPRPVHARAAEPGAPLPLAEPPQPGHDRRSRSRARRARTRGARAGRAPSRRRARTCRAAPIRARSTTCPTELRAAAGAIVDGGELPGAPSTVLDLSGAGAARPPRGSGSGRRSRSSASPPHSHGWPPAGDPAGRVASVRKSREGASMAVAQQSLEQLRSAGLTESIRRSRNCSAGSSSGSAAQIELIASENFTWPSVFEAIGSVPTNKYAEGYPGRRYYGGCEVVDEIEQLAIDRAKELFGAEHANVQPHAGAQANMAAYFALLQPGDTILSLRLDHGGHLTHGLKVNFSGRLYTIAHYGVSRETNMVDYDEVLDLAKEHRPKLIVCGGSAYPRTVEAGRVPQDRRRGRRAADVRHGPLLGARRRRAAPEPGGALRRRHLDDPQDALPARAPASSSAARSTPRRSTAPSFPGCRAARSCTRSPPRRRASGSQPPSAFREYQTQVRANADALSDELMQRGLDVLTGGTDTHLLQLDLRGTDWTGKDAEERLAEVKLTVNRNTVPFDERPPTVASGVRIGTPAATMRGFDEEDFREVGRIIDGALGEGDVGELAARAEALCEKRPLLPRLPGLHDVRIWRDAPPESVTHVDASARAAQALVPARQGDADRPLPQARERADAAPHVRGDEGLPDRAGRDRDAARADGGAADLGQEGRRLPGAARGHRDARGRALADLERARRLHRPVPRRGDARARRVLREAAGGPGRARRDRARPDARDRQLERSGDRER